MPKATAMADIYCQLLQNYNDAEPFYEQKPRMWAFEVTFNGVLIFSKLMHKVWPN